MANDNLHAAKRAKNDEFYTQWVDVERELIAYLTHNPDLFRGKVVLLPCDDPEWSNFTKFFATKFDHIGLKALISTSYNPGGQGKVFRLERDVTGDGRTNMSDLTWQYLEGDGDFRSPEVTALRDEADFIITNPPFSLFREFLAWIVEGNVQFSIIGNKNIVTFKEVFPLIQSGELWSGVEPWAGGMWFRLPEGAEKVDRMDDGVPMGNVPSIWVTNIDHARRHQPLDLMTAADNLRYNDKFAASGGYQRYDNYDAIEVPKTKLIPSDYPGVMGVPISFLDKFNPDQFEIVGSFNAGAHGVEVGAIYTETVVKGKIIQWNGPVVNRQPLYKRILIRHRNHASITDTKENAA